MSHLSTNPALSTLSTATDACPDVATELETALSTASVAATFLPPSLLSPTAPARRARKAGAKKSARKRAARPKTDKKSDKTDKTVKSENVVNVASLDTEKADRADDAEVTGSTDDASERAAQTRVQATQVTDKNDKNDKTKMKARGPLGDSLDDLMVDQTIKDITKRLALMPERRGPCANAEYLQPSVKCAPTKLGAFKSVKSSSNPMTRLSNMLNDRGWQFVNAKNHCTYTRTVIFEDGTRTDQHFSHSKTTSDNYHGPMKALCDLKCLEDDVCVVIL